MQFRVNPKSGESLSVLGYGCMRFSKRGGVIDQEKAEREMLLALENGVNYFDTAYIYPGSEACLGKFIQRYQCRDRLYIATKLPQYRVQKIDDAEKFFREELERLRTDHVDYYLMHMLNDASSWQRLCALGIREWIADKKKSGAIRHIGFSFHGGTRQFKELVDAYDWEFCQIQFNYMDEYSQAGIEGLRYAHEKDPAGRQAGGRRFQGDPAYLRHGGAPPLPGGLGPALDLGSSRGHGGAQRHERRIPGDRKLPYRLGEPAGHSDA